MAYNSLQYNTAQYNGLAPGVGVVISTDLLVFNGFSIANNETLFISFLEDNMPQRRILGGATPREDGEYFNADYWQRKVITARGWATAASAVLLEELLDDMRLELAPPEKFLDITRDSVVRRYTASLINGDRIFSGREGTWVTFTKFEVQFLCKTPFATERNFTTESESNVVASPTTLAVCNEGTIEAQPIITAVFDAATGVTTLNIVNVTTGDEIEVTPSGGIVPADVVEFDSEEKTVKINGVEEDYTGSFPVLDTGSNLIRFTTTGTTFDFTATVKWKKRFL